jgi:hypothetical protein
MPCINPAQIPQIDRESSCLLRKNEKVIRSAAARRLLFILRYMRENLLVKAFACG